MFRCLRLTPAAVLLFVAMFWAASAPGSAAQDKSAKTPILHGKLIGFDPDLNLIRVTKGSGTAALVMDKNIKFTIDDLPTDTKYTDLKPNTYLDLTLSADKSTVLAINAEGPEIKRTIDAIDLEKNTIRVHLGKKEETLTFIKNVVVTNMKNKATIDEVKPGSFAALRLSADGTQLIEIHLQLPPKKK